MPTRQSAKAEHRRLDRFLGTVAGQVEPTISVLWCHHARDSFEAVAELVDVAVPNPEPAHLDWVGRWLSELSVAVPLTAKKGAVVAAEAVNSLALVRRRAMNTCQDLAAMCPVS